MRFSHCLCCLYVAMLLVSVTLTGCSNRPDNVLSTHDMAAVLADIHEAEGVIEQDYNNYKGDSAKITLRQSVYLKHGIDAATMDTSLAWYGYNIDKYQEVYEEVIDILDKRLAGIKVSPVQSMDFGSYGNVEGDSAIVWRDLQPRYFHTRLFNKPVTAVLSRDRYWEDGDEYNLRFRTTDNRGPVEVTAAILYGDDTNDMVHRQFGTVGWHTMKLSVDTAKFASKVTISISYRPQPRNEVMAIDSITIMRTRNPFASANKGQNPK